MSSIPSSAAATASQTLTLAELRQARVFLEEARDGAAGAIRLLSDAQWKFKPAADRWSIAEILDHVIFVQERVMGPMWEQLAAAPAPPVGYDTKAVDGIAIHQFVNRITKFPAPEFALPAGRYSQAEAADRLAKNHSKAIECLESTPGLRLHVIESMPLKAITQGAFQLMDGYQWLLAVAAHTQRHTKQILEVAADRNFPVN